MFKLPSLLPTHLYELWAPSSLIILLPVSLFAQLLCIVRLMYFVFLFFLNLHILWTNKFIDVHLATWSGPFSTIKSLMQSGLTVSNLKPRARSYSPLIPGYESEQSWPDVQGRTVQPLLIASPEECLPDDPDSGGLSSSSWGLSTVRNLFL